MSGDYAFILLAAPSDAGNPLGKSGTPDRGLFLSGFYGCRLYRRGAPRISKTRLRGAQRRDVNADINVTVFAPARRPHPYIIFEADSKC